MRLAGSEGQSCRVFRPHVRFDSEWASQRMRQPVALATFRRVGPGNLCRMDETASSAFGGFQTQPAPLPWEACESFQHAKTICF